MYFFKKEKQKTVFSWMGRIEYSSSLLTSENTYSGIWLEFCSDNLIFAHVRSLSSQLDSIELIRG